MRLAIVLVLVFASISSSPAQVPLQRAAEFHANAEWAEPAEAAKKPASPREPPLPEDALQRYGSMAWRHNGSIRIAALSRDGKTLITFTDRSMAVWDTATGGWKQHLRGLDVLESPSGSAAVVSPEGNWAAWLGNDNDVVHSLDIASGRERWVSGTKRSPDAGPKGPGDDRYLDSLYLSPDGKELLASNGKVLRVLDASDGKELRKFEMPGFFYAMSDDGRLAATQGIEENFLIVRDLKSGKQLARTEGDLAPTLKDTQSLQVAFSPDGKLLATTIDANDFQLWSTATGKLVKTLKDDKPSGKREDAKSIQFSRDGKVVFASGDTDLSPGIRRWNIETGKKLSRLGNSWHPILITLPDARTLLSCGYGAIERWDIELGKELPEPPRVFDGSVSVLLSPDSKTLMTFGRFRGINAWETASGKRITEFDDKLRRSLSFAFSPDGKQFVAETAEGITTFDTSTWKVKDTAALPENLERFSFRSGFNRIVFPDKFLCAGQLEKKCTLYDLSARKAAWTIDESLGTLTVAPAGNLFACVSATGISIRQLSDGKQVRSIPFHDKHRQDLGRLGILPDDTSMAFTSDGNWLAEMEGDRDVAIWNSRTGAQLWRLKGSDHFHFSLEHRYLLAFSPDDRWLVSGHSDGTVRIWEMASGAEVRRFSGHEVSVDSVGFARDGRSVVSSAGFEVLRWRLAPKSDSMAEPLEHWQGLAGDASNAYRAMWSLVSLGKRSIELLDATLTPAPKADEKRLVLLIADLDNDRFAVRDKASKELASCGAAAEKLLEAARSKGGSTELTDRIDHILKTIRQPPIGKELQSLRAIHAIELIGGADAKRLLKKLSEGAPGVRLTQEAAKSLRRME